MHRIALLMLAAACLCASAALANAGDRRPVEEQAYCGLTVSDYGDSGTMVVGWILPGPLQGTTFESPFMNRGDLILSVNGKPMKQAEFTEFIEASKPGDTVLLKVRNTKPQGVGSTPTPGSGTEERDVKLVLARRSDWSGPIAWPRPFKRQPDPVTLLGDPAASTTLEAFLFNALSEQKQKEPIDRLLKLFETTQKKNLGFHSLSRVAAGFFQPTRLPQLQRIVTDPLHGLPQSPEKVMAEIARNLDVSAPEAGASAALDLTDTAAALDTIASVLADANADCLRAFDGVPAETRAELRERVERLFDAMSSKNYLSSLPGAGELLATMRATMAVDYGALLQAEARVLRLALMPSVTPGKLPETVAAPEELRDRVRGPILAARRTEAGWIVVGGVEANEYDMSQLACVLDLGGDDVYRYPEGPRPDVQCVMDLAGNDRHEGASLVAGSALLGGQCSR